MARILFTWELGGGLGHLVRYKGLIASLVQDGHQIHYIARNAEKVGFVNPQPEIQVAELSPAFTPRPQQIIEPRLASYSTLLFNCGFSDVDSLAARLQRWVVTIKAIRPDCIVADHSPTALLANRVLGIPLIIAGNGFTLPPANQPMPLFQPEKSENPAINLDFENRLCGILNASIRKIGSNTPDLASPSELLTVDQSWLMTFKEFDCYELRAGGTYLGTYPNDAFGENFDWPVATGPKVFAYLGSAKGLEALGQWVTDQDASLCLVMPKLNDKCRQIIQKSFPTKNIYLSEKPVSFSKIANEATLGISNGNANTVANLALAGLPQLAIPLSMENYMEARQTVRARCGLMLPGPDFSKLGAKLSELVDNAIYRQAARNFNLKYAGSSSETQTQHMLNKLHELLV